MTNIVSPKQTDFINTLLAERDVKDEVRALAAHVRTTLEASFYISSLLTFPKLRAAAAAPPASPEYREYLAALAAVEVSKYAIPTRYLRTYPTLSRLRGDLLFVEVKTYKGKRYLNRLTGAPGSFLRSSIPRSEALPLLRLMAGRHVEFARLFGENFQCCGRCAAPLTDKESRETGFGPTCRAIFGI